jgi:hypothetical protein
LLRPTQPRTNGWDFSWLRCVGDDEVSRRHEHQTSAVRAAVSPFLKASKVLIGRTANILLFSQLPAIVGPVQQRLPLPSAAPQITRLARKLKLPHVTADCFPAFDLPNVLVRHSSPHVVAAVPLEPAAWIVGVDPSFPAPFRQRLTGIDTEVVE